MPLQRWWNQVSRHVFGKHANLFISTGSARNTGGIRGSRSTSRSGCTADISCASDTTNGIPPAPLVSSTSSIRSIASTTSTILLVLHSTTNTTSTTRNPPHAG